MELRHLRYFVTVADFLHFGKAAQELRIAQPSLSHQIFQLEAELQTKLFERTKRRVRLTDSGARLLQQSRQILELVDQASLLARTGRSREQEVFRIGFGYWMDVMKMCAAVRRFKESHPGVHVELYSMNVPQQIEGLREDRIDAGFVRPPVTDPAVESEFVIREPFVVSMPMKHRLANEKRISVDALKEEAIIMPPRGKIPFFYDLLLKIFQDAGFVPKVHHEVDYPTMVLGLVSTGVGISLVPTSISKIAFSGVVYRPLQPSSRVIETVLAWRKGRTMSVLNDFRQIVRDVTAPRRRGGRGPGRK